MITEIHIKGYKSIRDQVVPLSSINILIGGNGVGKSNFISVFSLVRNIYNKNLRSYVIEKGGADSFLHFGKKKTEKIEIDFFFGGNGDAYNRFIVTLGLAQDNLFVKSTETAFYSGIWHRRVYERDVTESNFKSYHTGQAYYVNDMLSEFEVYHFHDTGDKSPMKGKSQVYDNRFLRRDGSNIAAFLYYLQQKHPKHFARIEKAIQSIAPFFEAFSLEPDRLNEDEIQLTWSEKGSDSLFNAYHLSDGTLRFICLATLLMQPEPPVTIIIDEPELGLHPVAINKLAGLIRKASVKTQIIISSQSVNLVDNFEPENIIVSDRENNASIFRRLEKNELDSWIKDYSMGEIWEKNIIGGQPL